MKYTIDSTKLTSEEKLYLENFESSIIKYIEKEIKNNSNLGVSLYWTVIQKSGKFLNISHNADFDIPDSLNLQNKIESYIKQKLQIEFDECSLNLEVKYRKLPCQTKSDDNLPTFTPTPPHYSFDQIILPDETRKRIYNDLNTIKYQDLIYNQWGFSEVDNKPKSILNFFGPPGTGKTMCAHAIAKMLNKPLLALNYSEIESKYVGDAAKNLKKAFETAYKINAVMFFDEADSFLGKRIENVSQGADQALNSLRSQMLILLEDFEGVVLFATNLVTNFDKAFESRILDHIKLELPNKEARAEIISKMLPSKLPIESITREDFLELSDMIDGFAGREIKSAVLTMLLDKAGLEETNPKFSLEDLKQALIKKKEQIETLKEEEKKRRAEKISKRLRERLEEDAKYEQQRKKTHSKNKKR